MGHLPPTAQKLRRRETVQGPSHPDGTGHGAGLCPADRGGCGPGARAVGRRRDEEPRPLAFAPGGSGTYTITVTNSGPQLTQLALLDQLPPGMTPTAADGGALFNCAVNPTTVGCLLVGTLESQQTAQFTVTVAVAPEPPEPLECVPVNQVFERDLDSPEPVTVLVAEDPTPVLYPGCPGLARPTVAKSHVEGQFTQGGQGTYEIVIGNVQGTTPTSSLTVTDAVPAALPVSSVTAPAGFTCSNAGQDVTCSSAAGLPPGGSATITVVVSVPASAPCGSVTNQVNVQDSVGVRTAASTVTVTGSGCGGGGGGGSVLPISLNGIFTVYNNIGTANNINSPGGRVENHQSFR
ncbi:hypothetical protein [Streptomyces sp. NPDC089919]|uniref:DUF7933 domain-containing protein n=1 Tax=Streptomyces sp. NPDC089919 TaxID=3155188 RepID=UPI003444BC97